MCVLCIILVVCMRCVCYVCIVHDVRGMYEVCVMFMTINLVCMCEREMSLCVTIVMKVYVVCVNIELRTLLFGVLWAPV